MRERQRDELFARARRAASPTDADKRRVRASLSRALGAAAVTSVGATASKAAASVTETALAAAVRASAAAVGKVALALLIASAVASVAVPAFRNGKSHPDRTTAATSGPSTIAPPVKAGVGVEKVEQNAIRHDAVVAPVEATSRAPADARRAPFLVESTASAPARLVTRIASDRTASAPIAAHASVVSGSALERPEGAPSSASSAREVSSALPTPDGPPVRDAAAELELLAKIQSALRDGDSDGVLRLVVEHERRYPVSAWAEDRDGARVLALCTRSSPSEAAALGQRFLSAHGRSTLGGRVRSACHLDPSSR